MSYPHYTNECAEHHDLVRDFEGSRPKIVCLCGSTRFFKEFAVANFVETMRGSIVLSVGFYANAKESDWSIRKHGENVGITPDEKKFLDQLHLRKIELADEVFVVDVDGYIGESTRNEIAHAVKHGKKIRRWTEDPSIALYDQPERPNTTTRYGLLKPQ